MAPDVSALPGPRLLTAAGERQWGDDAELLTTVLRQWEPNTRARQQAHDRFRQLWRQAGWSWPPEVATMRGNGKAASAPEGVRGSLAMPVSWKGTLHQYAGRLHRQQSGKTSVRIIDWLDLGHPVPQRMWERRLRGYRAMGYEPTSTRRPRSGGGHVRPSPVQ